MRFQTLKKLSFGVAIASMVVAGSASAQTLVGVTTKLDRTLDSKSAAAGQVVTTKLNGTVKTTDGVKLPKGTELIGKVAEVKAAQNGSPASVSLVFTSAKLKDGKEIPVKATVLAVYPESAGDGATYGAETMGPAPEQVEADGTFQQAGALRNISMTSAVKSSASGTFSSTDGNVRLEAGTYLQVGIAPAGAASGTNAAE
jgi:hypothetical protein